MLDNRQIQGNTPLTDLDYITESIVNGFNEHVYNYFERGWFLRKPVFGTSLKDTKYY
jgi:hypothetical protein